MLVGMSFFLSDKIVYFQGYVRGQIFDLESISIVLPEMDYAVLHS